MYIRSRCNLFRVYTENAGQTKKAFGTEMAVLHEAAEEDLARVVPPKTAALIVKARSGKLELKAGGGGTYGKIKP